MKNIQKRVTLLLKILVVLCVLDAILTIIWVGLGLAIEANPIMNILLKESNVHFLIIKLTISYGCIYILYKFRRKALAYYATLGLTSAYLLLFIHHIFGVLTP